MVPLAKVKIDKYRQKLAHGKNFRTVADRFSDADLLVKEKEIWIPNRVRGIETQLTDAHEIHWFGAETESLRILHRISMKTGAVLGRFFHPGFAEPLFLLGEREGVWYFLTSNPERNSG